MGEGFALVVPDFALILLGALLARRVMVQPEFWNGVERLVYFVLFPAMLFRSLATAPNLGAGAWALLGAAAVVPAAEISEELRQALQSDLAAIEKETPQMGEVMAALREIGAAYVPELVAPVDVDRYQGVVRRRIMTGTYLMDLTYASTFGRQADAARYGQAVCQLLELVDDRRAAG